MFENKLKPVAFQSNKEILNTAELYPGGAQSVAFDASLAASAHFSASSANLQTGSRSAQGVQGGDS